MYQHADWFRMVGLLAVEDLKTHFFTYDGIVRAVEGVSFEIVQGEIFGLVGETGSGKSATCLSILRLIYEPGRIIGGRILLDGVDLMKLNEKEMRQIRGGEIAIVFQDPSAALDPVFTVGDQVTEAISLHQHLRKREAWHAAVQALRLVEIPSAEQRAKNYPHEFSGGMKQRVMIAMSLSCRPKLLIADEPTTGLDVTTQAQIMALLKEIKESLKTSILLVTHDLGLVAEMCDRVAVMYAGEIVELAETREIFKKSRHPYTIGLLGAIPLPHLKREKLEVIPGTVPSLIDPPSGCKFHPRCTFAREICQRVHPTLEEVRPGHFVACHFHEEVAKNRI